MELHCIHHNHIQRKTSHTSDFINSCIRETYEDPQEWFVFCCSIYDILDFPYVGVADEIVQEACTEVKSL